MTETSSAPAPTLAIAFAGGRGALAGLVLRVGLLNLLTLGFYRFWAKTRLRRYFWNNLAIAGEPVEYTGRPIELLLGFLIVLAILAPLSLTVSGLQFLAGTAGPQAVFAAQLAYPLLLLSLWPIAVYRARRYRLSRTQWRGIRFGQDGSALRFAVIASLYGLLTIATAGLAYPWMRAALQRFKTVHTRFGTLGFSFVARAKSLLPAWLLFWGVAMLAGALAARAFAGPAASLAARLGAPSANTAGVAGLGFDLAAAAAVAFAAFAAAALYVNYRLVEFRVFAAGTRAGPVGFEARPRLVLLLLIAAAWAAGFVLVLALLAVGAMALVVAAGGNGGILALGLPAMLVLAFFLLMPLVKYAILYHGLMSHLTATLDVRGLDGLDTVVQDAQPTPRRGEGLADALDIDVGAF